MLKITTYYFLQLAPLADRYLEPLLALRSQLYSQVCALQKNNELRILTYIYKLFTLNVSR